MHLKRLGRVFIAHCVFAVWLVLEGVQGVWNPKTLRQKLPGHEVTERSHPPLRSRCFRDFREGKCSLLHRSQRTSPKTSTFSKNVTSSKVPFRPDEEGAEEKYRPASSKTWTYIGIRSRDFEPPRLSKSVLSRVEDRH